MSKILSAIFIQPSVLEVEIFFSVFQFGEFEPTVVTYVRLGDVVDRIPKKFQYINTIPSSAGL